MAFLRAFPAVNPGVFLAGILIGSPVCGFLPFLAALDRTINVPNPVTTTLLPFFKVSVIAPKTALTASLDALLVRLAFFATKATRSDLVIEIYFHLLYCPSLSEGGQKNLAGCYNTNYNVEDFFLIVKPQFEKI